MKFASRILSAATATIILASCGSGKGTKDLGDTASMPPKIQVGNSVSDYPVKIGDPYSVNGKTYTPQDVMSYDEVGYASVYGSEFAGRSTANGEAFIVSGVSAAHKTLPLPSYVEVTALDTGRTILVRINDRGPMASDRLIDLSEGAARQLGILEKGLAGVRVRRVNPPEQDRAVLRSGIPAANRIDTPNSLLTVLRSNLSKLPRPAAITSRPEVVSASVQPDDSYIRENESGDDGFIREGSASQSNQAVRPRAPKPSAAPAKGNDEFIREGNGGNSVVSGQVSVAGPKFYVQVASFSTRQRADAYAKQIGASVSPSNEGKLFRVKFGPYANETDAQRGLATARQRGYPNSRVFRE
jgi:rare lipoprotein A